MNTIGVHCRASSFLIAVVTVLPLSPCLASAQPHPQQAIIEGTQSPVGSVQGTDKNDRHGGAVEVTFTKWRTAVLPPPPATPSRRLFKGYVGGDLGAGDLVAEVLDRKDSTLCTAVDPPCTPDIPVTGSITALQAIYDVRVGEQSFTALIQGGTNGATGAALLNGVVLAGWRTGAKVSVAFQTITNCADAPPGTTTCFQGVIRVGRAPEE